MHDLQKRPHDPGLQLDHPEQLQRRARRDLPRQQPVRCVHRQRDPELQLADPLRPGATTPTNYTGGLYASDLFLQYYIPLIEQSAAFKEGGLIDVTFDEANPAVHHRKQLQQRRTLPAHVGGQAELHQLYHVRHGGREPLRPERQRQPTGPNSTLGVNKKGDQLYPGPGNNAFVDRPPVCTQTSPVTPVPANCVPACVTRRREQRRRPRTDHRRAAAPGPTSSAPRSRANDTGRAVTGSNIPASSFVGAVTNTGPDCPATNTGPVTTVSFQLVGAERQPASDPDRARSRSITLSSPQGDPSDPGTRSDPRPARSTPPAATTGGGDTGSAPDHARSSSRARRRTRYYNHYSWLRTMEDIFGVADGHDHTPLPAGTVSGGLDGQGHLGFAAQAGLRGFGPDVFNHP